ncbi:flagellar basal body-associated FliL family protein [Ochrobactrum quorumnocens]|jgi:flagellar FliL protein|uniref:Flagellar protein FliL n=1 Tax=Ochrobactrum quorumnocens TaxID=271865 RepID=A0A248UE33_9HYPH|nr:MULTISPECIES: flagellar basal body-associated FliL family protein [Brucella/Ochrobactrum group]ASV84790.1 flagellar basal body-associated FliL family protein [[Ochrobactrum] quorumnocens]KAA9368528.1 flagellar basal body-associated FliL family protein [[Ochrobactrum] quorumnocens]MBD7989855.1 flagellar basal body-associated FliL family protein [Ochrobactrum gallinarum]MDH7791021.1 flagellar FliL protein [Ochrobactrum sp. AN78]
MSDTAIDKDGKAKTSIVGLLAAVAVLTAIAGGGGWYLGGVISAEQQVAAKPTTKDDKPKQGDFESRSIGTIVPLQPIVTNLGIPQTTWVRLEASLVAKPGREIPADMAASVGDDFMSFLRSVNLMQLQGAAGLAYLRADLEERARMRSEGAVDRVFISTLVVE